MFYVILAFDSIDDARRLADNVDDLMINDGKELYGSKANAIYYGSYDSLKEMEDSFSVEG